MGGEQQWLSLNVENPKKRLTWKNRDSFCSVLIKRGILSLKIRIPSKPYRTFKYVRIRRCFAISLPFSSTPHIIRTRRTVSRRCQLPERASWRYWWIPTNCTTAAIGTRRRYRYFVLNRTGRGRYYNYLYHVFIAVRPTLTQRSRARPIHNRRVE